MKILLILLLILSYELNADELEWVDEQINAIKPPRNGISKSKIDIIRSPFNLKKKPVEVILDKDMNVVAKKEITLSLHAIINKSAFINEKWYKLNDKIDKYTITSIERTIVLLSFKKKTLLLSIKSKNKNLKFKE